MKELKISNIVLVVLSAISIIILGMFFFIGYDIPWEDNPSMVNPQFTDVLLWWNIILIGLTIVIAVGSVIMQIVKGSSMETEKGLAGKTDVLAVALLVVSIIAGFIYGGIDLEMIAVNNKAWNPAAPENVTDNMTTVVCIISIAILGVVTAIVTIASMIAGMLKK